MTENNTQEKSHLETPIKKQNSLEMKKTSPSEEKHKHVKPDCKLCFAMWKDGYEQAEKDIKKHIQKAEKELKEKVIKQIKVEEHCDGCDGYGVEDECDVCKPHFNRIRKIGLEIK